MNNSDNSSSRKNCKFCGKVIAKARLEALPGVVTCIECAKKHPPRVDAAKLDLSEASAIDRTGFARHD